MQIQRDCTLSSADWFVLNVYGSEFCKETYSSLDALTLPEFMILEQYVAVREACKAAAHKDEEIKAKSKR